MTHVQTSAQGAILRVRIEKLVAEHGKWRVIAMALAAAVRGRRRATRVRPQELPAAMRRDLGLPPVVDPPTAPSVLSVYMRP